MCRERLPRTLRLWLPVRCAARWVLHFWIVKRYPLIRRRLAQGVRRTTGVLTLAVQLKTLVLNASVQMNYHCLRHGPCQLSPGLLQRVRNTKVALF